MFPMTKKEEKKYKKQKSCHIYQKKFNDMFNKDGKWKRM